MAGLGLAMTGAAAAAVTPRRHEQVIGRTRLEDLIPNAVGAWRSTPGDNLILPSSDEPNSYYDQVATRTFVGPDLPGIMLLIAYGAAQSGMMKVHRPEVCYGSAGFSIHDFRADDIELDSTRRIAAQSFLAKREDRTEQVLYWTRISNAFPRDLTSQRLVMIERGLRGYIPDGVLVRVSMLGTNIATGRQALEDFARDMIAGAQPLERRLLVGSPTVAAHA